MAHYRQVGPVPGKRHTLFKDDDGRILSEELMGEEGFSSDSSLLYHRHIPSSIVGARPWELPDQTLTPNEPLLPGTSSSTASSPTSRPRAPTR